MRKLDELIAELCPDGVEYKCIGDFANCVPGATPKTSKPEFWENGTIPWMSSGEVNLGTITFTEKKITQLGYDNTSTKMVPVNSVVIALAGQGKTRGLVAITRIPLCTNQSLCAITPNDTVLSEYLLHFLRSQYQQLRDVSSGDGTRGGLNLKMINAYKVPVPPLLVQREIVRILDNFTQLTAELTAELQKRREQYRHYSTVLFDDAKKSGVHSIEEFCHIEKGKTPIQKAIPGGYPMVVTTTERKSCDTYQFDAKAVCVPLVSSRGHGVASLNHVYYQEGKFALGNILCAIIPKNEEQVYPKYLYFYFEQTKDYTLVPLMKGGANVALHMNDVEKVKVPIPSLEEQKRIVDILDHFETLCNDISVGLPAEIEARQKQYEYFQNKLLTFKELS